MSPPDRLVLPGRRRLCRSGLATAAGVLGAAVGATPGSLVLAASSATLPSRYHGGRILPVVPVPNLIVDTADGARRSLHQLLLRRATAIQLIFTGCSTTCPIQGVVFQQVQSLLPDMPGRSMQLLSLSINPLEDTPASLQAWQARFRPAPGWIAARPTLADLETVLTLFAGGRESVENHATQVQMINRRGELIWRTYELPSAQTVASILQQM